MSAFTFPSGFLWGAATSAHQVEGNNIHSDWWAWEQAGRVKDRSGLACDHYRRFAADFDLAASLHHNAHRFSIEWSRIEPAQDRWDDEALAHYVEVVRALRARHLEPIVTLHHFTNPQWLLAQGGWTTPGAIDRFARYVRRVVEALGDEVTYWITINEPMVYVRMHYLQGLGPPGARDMRQALSVIRHLLEAHAIAYRIIHERESRRPSPTWVSIAQYVPAFRACRSWWPLDRAVAWFSSRLFHEAVLEALIRGRWSIPGLGRWTLSGGCGTLDFLGLNFYGRRFLRCGTSKDGWLVSLCDLDRHAWHAPERTAMGWDVYPDAFRDVLLREKRWGRPILVTENGAWTRDDHNRQRYLEGCIGAMASAMQAGAHVVGYCYWSLLDNFEWADGYAPRFGLIEVDYATQQRRIRGSARRYADICRSNAI